MKQVIGLVFLTLFFCDGLAQKPSGRIVNGTATSVKDYPFMVGLYENTVFSCGATVITDKHVLTAAHCLYERPDPSELLLLAGGSQLYSGEVFTVYEYALCPEYNPTTRESDAAIITINESFAAYKTINAIPLQSKDITYSPDNPTWCSVIGWGATNWKTQESKNLNVARMLIISQYDCTQKWKNSPKITWRTICAELSGTNACIGDDGGPLVCNGEQTGIVSWSQGGCDGKLPSVYAKVTASNIRQFIKNIAGV